MLSIIITMYHKSITVAQRYYNKYLTLKFKIEINYIMTSRLQIGLDEWCKKQHFYAEHSTVRGSAWGHWLGHFLSLRYSRLQVFNMISAGCTLIIIQFKRILCNILSSWNDERITLSIRHFEINHESQIQLLKKTPNESKARFGNES